MTGRHDCVYCGAYMRYCRVDEHCCHRCQRVIESFGLCYPLTTDELRTLSKYFKPPEAT